MQDRGGSVGKSSWVLEAAAAVEGSVAWLEEGLTPDMYTVLVGAVIGAMAGKMESAILRGSSNFTQLGGLQFDRDVRNLIQLLAPIAPGAPVRERLGRLTQAAALISFETVDEVAEFYGGGGSSPSMTEGGTTEKSLWKLAPSELRQVMALRVDWLPEDLQRLKL